MLNQLYNPGRILKEMLMISDVWKKKIKYDNCQQELFPVIQKFWDPFHEEIAHWRMVETGSCVGISSRVLLQVGCRRQTISANGTFTLCNQALPLLCKRCAFH